MLAQTPPPGVDLERPKVLQIGTQNDAPDCMPAGHCPRVTKRPARRHRLPNGQQRRDDSCAAAYDIFASGEDNAEVSDSALSVEPQLMKSAKVVDTNGTKATKQSAHLERDIAQTAHKVDMLYRGIVSKDYDAVSYDAKFAAEEKNSRTSPSSGPLGGWVLSLASALCPRELGVRRTPTLRGYCAQQGHLMRWPACWESPCLRRSSMLVARGSIGE